MATETALKQNQLLQGSRNASEAVPPARQEVRSHESAYSLLTHEVREVLDKMLPLVVQEVGTISKIEVYGTAPSDEIEAHLVVSVKTELFAEEAFALWDRVGDAVQVWTTALPEPQKEIALEIAIEVLWNVDHAAA